MHYGHGAPIPIFTVTSGRLSAKIVIG
jgi:hypothetical protein